MAIHVQQPLSLLRLPAVKARVGLCRSSIYAKIAAGEFPSPINLGARAVAVATGWHTSEELAVHEPDLLLTDLADPTALIECWNG